MTRPVTCLVLALLVGALLAAGCEKTRDIATKDSVITPFQHVVQGDPLNDAEIDFIHQRLLKTSTSYTENGLQTYADWELIAHVTRVDRGFELRVHGPRVNAEWLLFVDAATGEVTLKEIGTIEEPPEELE